jgi:hypothetical protein
VGGDQPLTSRAVTRRGQFDQKLLLVTRHYHKDTSVVAPLLQQTRLKGPLSAIP